MYRKIPLFGVVHLPEMEKASIEVMRSGKIAHGPFVSLFEKELAQLLKQPNLLTTSDVSCALHLALHVAGVTAGDEVLTTSYACMSTNAVIASMGAKAVWVDLAPNSMHLDLTLFEAAVTPQTKAVVLYHVAGYPGPSEQLAAICHRRGIKLIEDCDNAMFAQINNQYAGTFGDFTVYSFYPNREINTMEGGALVCQSAADAQKARLLRRFGINLDFFRLPSGEINSELDIPEAGWSYAMSNLSAAVGHSQLKSLTTRLNKTQGNVKKLLTYLSNLPQIHLVPIQPNNQPAYWVLLIQINLRDSVNAFLKQRGIESSILHYRNDKYTCFGTNDTFLPNTVLFQNTVLALPCGWWLEDEDIKFIIDSLSLAFTEYSVPQWKNI
jgi:perosamine synthetase